MLYKLIASAATLQHLHEHIIAVAENTSDAMLVDCDRAIAA